MTLYEAISITKEGSYNLPGLKTETQILNICMAALVESDYKQVIVSEHTTEFLPFIGAEKIIPKFDFLDIELNFYSGTFTDSIAMMPIDFYNFFIENDMPKLSSVTVNEGVCTVLLYYLP